MRHGRLGDPCTGAAPQEARDRSQARRGSLARVTELVRSLLVRPKGSHRAGLRAIGLRARIARGFRAAAAGTSRRQPLRAASAPSAPAASAYTAYDAAGISEPLPQLGSRPEGAQCDRRYSREHAMRYALRRRRARVSVRAVVSLRTRSVWRIAPRWPCCAASKLQTRRYRAKARLARTLGTRAGCVPQRTAAPPAAGDWNSPSAFAAACLLPGPLPHNRECNSSPPSVLSCLGYLGKPHGTRFPGCYPPLLLRPWTRSRAREKTSAAPRKPSWKPSNSVPRHCSGTSLPTCGVARQSHSARLVPAPGRCSASAGLVAVAKRR